MSVTPLKNQIIDWLKNQQYWMQFSGNKILEGNPIDQPLIDETYSFFKEDYELTPKSTSRKDIEYNEVTTSKAVLKDTKLVSIKEIENVNALETNQEIPISKNLTVIYGDNGAGKSGYIRLLNNAFFNSRGDKLLLPNVFNKTTKGSPKCSFVFNNGSDSYSREFPTDERCLEFSQFSVFDTQSVKVHLDGDNQLNFTPTGFEFFDKILVLFDALKTKLTQEIESHKPSNQFVIHFKNENIIKNQISTLSHQTNIEELKKNTEFGELDEKKLDELNSKLAELRSLNIKDKISSIDKLLSKLNNFTLNQQSLLDLLTIDKIEYYKSLIQSYHDLKELSISEGIKSFEDFEIKNIGSSEWRNFIIAAKTYASQIANESSDNYPNDGDNCLFCLQPLNKKENILITAYWTFLKSEAEKELNRTTQKISEELILLKSLTPIKFDDSTSLHTYLNGKSPEITSKWKPIVDTSETAKQNLITSLESLKSDFTLSVFKNHTSEFDSLKNDLKQEKDLLFAKKPDQEIASLTFQIQLLTDKSLLSKLLPDILNFVNSHNWAYKAERSLSAFKTNSITSLQGSLFSEHITQNYTDTFFKECESLNAPKVVELSQRNSKVSTYRKLSVAKNSASHVLSEGEQRAISLADFLTEAQLNPDNIGLIFDDPVTSLDHKRRENIAIRLVELSKKKQVIVFTHDIAFFSKLTSIGDKIDDLEVRKTSIRKFGDTVGIIKPDLPWIAQKIKDRLKYLGNELVRLQKLEKLGEEEQYNMLVKGWYGFLREAWERSVEERLFKTAIERFSGEVHTRPLSQIEINEEMVKMIEEGMTQSSKWVHDQAMGLNPPIPNSTTAERDLKLLVDFAELCKPLR